jgi:hypothetical protein
MSSPGRILTAPDPEIFDRGHEIFRGSGVMWRDRYSTALLTLASLA